MEEDKKERNAYATMSCVVAKRDLRSYFYMIGSSEFLLYEFLTQAAARTEQVTILIPGRTSLGSVC